MKSVAVALVAALLAAGAAQARLGQRFPPGSITTAEQAQKALAAAEITSREADAEYQSALKRCASEFLVNPCNNKAREARDETRRDAQRVRLEANATRRRLDAEERARRRAEDEKRRKSSVPASSPAKASPDEQAPREKRAAENRARHEQRLLQYAEEEARRTREAEADAAARADNVKRFEDNQRRAAEHAKEKEAERIANERRRAERRKEREKRLNTTEEKK